MVPSLLFKQQTHTGFQTYHPLIACVLHSIFKRIKDVQYFGGDQGSDTGGIRLLQSESLSNSFLTLLMKAGLPLCRPSTYVHLYMHGSPPGAPSALQKPLPPDSQCRRLRNVCTASAIPRSPDSLNFAAEHPASLFPRWSFPLCRFL